MRTKNWKTTAVGVVQVLIFGLISFGVINADEGSSIQVATQSIFDSVGGGVVAVIGTTATAVGGVLLMFASDPKKDE